MQMQRNSGSIPVIRRRAYIVPFRRRCYMASILYRQSQQRKTSVSEKVVRVLRITIVTPGYFYFSQTNSLIVIYPRNNSVPLPAGNFVEHDVRLANHEHWDIWHRLLGNVSHGKTDDRAAECQCFLSFRQTDTLVLPTFGINGSYIPFTGNLNRLSPQSPMHP